MIIYYIFVNPSTTIIIAGKDHEVKAGKLSIQQKDSWHNSTTVAMFKINQIIGWYIKESIND